ncbi:MAG TPA: ABC transporter permease [Candidatus Sulfotelmatobacter sp.]|nr:ABC transporter permease [Candidatus Sulfotelmatobacter sp.]
MIGALARGSMPAVPAGWRRHLELVRMSALRLLKTRYRGTSLGVLWSFANPILMTALYTTIFGTAFASYYGGSILRYVFSAFVGVTVVVFFSQATTEALSSVVANGGLLNKIALDPEIFPIAALSANAFQQLTTTFPVVLVLAAVLTHDPLRAVLVPIVFAGVLLLCAGFGLALAAFYVFFRDLLYLWGVFSFVIWMTCPVFYPAALVPAGIRPYLTMNPVGMAIGALREVTLGHGPIDFSLVGGFLAVAIVCACVGHALFRALRRDFMDLL